MKIIIALECFLLDAYPKLFNVFERAMEDMPSKLTQEQLNEVFQLTGQWNQKLSQGWLSFEHYLRGVQWLIAIVTQYGQFVPDLKHTLYRTECGKLRLIPDRQIPGYYRPLSNLEKMNNPMSSLFYSPRVLPSRYDISRCPPPHIKPMLGTSKSPVKFELTPYTGTRNVPYPKKYQESPQTQSIEVNQAPNLDAIVPRGETLNSLFSKHLSPCAQKLSTFCQKMNKMGHQVVLVTELAPELINTFCPILQQMNCVPNTSKTSFPTTHAFSNSISDGSLESICHDLIQKNNDPANTLICMPSLGEPHAFLFRHDPHRMQKAIETEARYHATAYREFEGVEDIIDYISHDSPSPQYPNSKHSL